MVERKKEFGGIIEFLAKREEAGKSSQEQINYAMENYFPLVRSYLMSHLEEKDKVLEQLRDFKENLQKDMGKKLSKPSVCAAFLVYNISLSYMKVAWDDYKDGNIEGFRASSDFATGSDLVLLSIARAEDELSEEGEETRLEVESFEHEINMPASEITEGHLKSKRDNANFLRLLQEDPSGFLLVDSMIGKAEEDPNLYMDVQAKVYVLEGARIARDLYKKLYEIAAPLYPAQQSE